MFLNSKKGFSLTLPMMVTALTVCAQSSVDVVADGLDHKSDPVVCEKKAVRFFKAIDPASLEIEKDLIKPTRTLAEDFRIIEAAKKGDLRSVNCVAGYYVDGCVLKKDLEKGIGLFLWSAERKNTNAMYELSKFYEQTDASKSIEWKKLAAAHGHFGASEDLYGSDGDQSS